MSIVPDFTTLVQVTAQKLMPQERHLLARAGVPRWFDLPHPWQPSPRQEAIVRRHCSGESALFVSVPHYLGAYELTELGEAVAGWFIGQAFAFGILVDGDLDPNEVANRLTPVQRNVLCQVVAHGSQRYPKGSPEIAVALGLTSLEWGLLEATDLIFRSTSLGVVVAELLLGVCDDC